MTKICIGSAQFGQMYGITNKAGKVEDEEIKKIIAKASEEGIEYIDTATNYGNAQESLGKTGYMNKFKIISKLSQQNKEQYEKEDERRWENELTNCLSNLGIEGIDTLLIHNAKDMIKPGYEYLQNWVEREKKRERIKYSGISIYEINDLLNIDIDQLDIIQGPLSIYDQRLVEGEFIKKLQEKGIKLMVRSIYLQGLLLQKETMWPKWISEEARIKHKRLRSWLEEKGKTTLQGTVDYLKSKEVIDIITVGICETRELNEFIHNWQKDNKNEILSYEQWGKGNEDIIDPRKWPKEKL